MRQAAKGKSMKLYVTNLHYKATDALLIDWFRRGKVTVLSCAIQRDAEGYSKRYGFVNIPDIDGPQAMKIAGKFMLGQAVRIKKASAPKSANTHKVGRR